MLPNFFIVGAAKAGTTTLYHQLRNHPAVFFPGQKEPNFFSLNGQPPQCTEYGSERIVANSVYRLADYEKLYQGSTATARGDASPSYLYSANAPAAIAGLIPNARIIAILRDPAERAFSAYLHSRSGGSETAATFAEALAAEQDHIAENWWFLSHYLAASRYGEQLKRYYDLFPRENIKIIDFGLLENSSEKTAREVADFLGLATDFPIHGERFNETAEFRNPIVRKLLKEQKFGVRQLKGLLPKQYRAKWKGSLQSLFAESRPQLSMRDRTRIIEELENDITLVEQLTNMSFAHWRTLETV